MRTQRPPLLAPAVALLGVVLLLTGWCAAQAGGGGAAAGGHQLNIGVVNTTRIIRAMQEAAKLDQELHARQADLVRQQQQKEAELQDMVKHRDNNLKPGSQQFKDETQQIIRKQAELAVWNQMNSLELNQWYNESLKGLYDHITAATAQVAVQQKLDLVIADQSSEIGPDLSKVTRQEMYMALQSRMVLYAGKKADITEDVLTMVQANFANQNPAPPPPAAPAGAAAPGK